MGITQKWEEAVKASRIFEFVQQWTWEILLNKKIVFIRF